MGATIEQEKKLTKPIEFSDDQVLIGHYLYDLGSLSHQITILRKNGVVSIIKTFSDGGQSTEALKDKVTSRGLRLDELENSYGEYYIVNQSGDLESWDTEGIIITLKKVMQSETE